MIEVPALTPCTIPADTVTWLLLALHVPPLTASLSDVFPPTATVDDPLIVPGSARGFTVTVVVAVLEPQTLLTV